MTDPENTPREEPEKQELPQAPDDAQRRFQRLLNGTEESSQTREPAPLDSQESASLQTGDRAAEGAGNVPSEGDASQAAGQGSEPLTDDAEPPAQLEKVEPVLPARHPTGQPDLTGGWFMQAGAAQLGEEAAGAEPTPAEPDPEAADQSPGRGIPGLRYPGDAGSANATPADVGGYSPAAIPGDWDARHAAAPEG